jgi:hypothetical protein
MKATLEGYYAAGFESVVWTQTSDVFDVVEAYEQKRSVREDHPKFSLLLDLVDDGWMGMKATMAVK